MRMNRMHTMLKGISLAVIWLTCCMGFAQSTTVSQLQTLSTWVQPGSTGNMGGGSPTTPNGVFQMTPGNPATFSMAASIPYAGAYWYYNIPGAWNSATYFEDQMRITFPSLADFNASQAIEFELQQNVGSTIYNMAFQFDFAGSHLVRTFDYNKSVWVPTNIPTSTFNPTGTNVIAVLFLRDAPSTTVTSLGMSINGVWYPVNATRKGTPRVESDYFHCAFQLDSNYARTPYSVNVDNMGVTMMSTSQ